MSDRRAIDMQRIHLRKRIENAEKLDGETLDKWRDEYTKLKSEYQALTALVEQETAERTQQLREATHNIINELKIDFKKAIKHCPIAYKEYEEALRQLLPYVAYGSGENFEIQLDTFIEVLTRLAAELDAAHEAAQDMGQVVSNIGNPFFTDETGEQQRMY